jgi:hypothetical protein
MEYFHAVIDRNHDRSFGAGAIMYFHRHMKGFPIHFHICITIAFWFAELHVGKENPRGEN